VSVAAQTEQAADLRILKVISLYHLLCGAVMALLPGDLLRFLGLEAPRYWLLYYVLAAASLVAGCLLQLAVRRAALRSGLVVAVTAGNVANCALFVFFVSWSPGLPPLLFAPAAASGLMAWLLWGLGSAEVLE